MNISDDTMRRLERAVSEQANYLPSPQIQAQLADKTLVMVIAPTTMGKTHIMKKVAEQDADFARVSVFTTREPRSDDQGMFRYLQKTDHDLNEIIGLIRQQQLVQYAIFPSSGQIYGSELSDFPARYNLLATLSNSVEQLRHVGFASAPAIGLVTDPDAWERWFESRYNERPAERPARLSEAAESIDWLLSHDDVRWLYNEPGNADAVARQLITLVKTGAYQPNESVIAIARALQERIKGMLEE